MNVTILSSVFVFCSVIVQTSQLSQFHSETHGFGPLLTVSLSTSDFSLSVLNSQGDPTELISQSDCYVVYNIHISCV